MLLPCFRTEALQPGQGILLPWASDLPARPQAHVEGSGGQPGSAHIQIVQAGAELHPDTRVSLARGSVCSLEREKQRKGDAFRHLLCRSLGVGPQHVCPQFLLPNPF